METVSCLTLCVVHSVMFSHAYPWSRSWIVASAGCFPEGFLDLLPPNSTHMDCHVGLEAKRSFSVGLASQKSWQARDVKNLGSKLFSRFPKGGTAKTRKILPKYVDTVSLHLASRCHSPAQNNHQKLRKNLVHSLQNFQWLDLCLKLQS